MSNLSIELGTWNVSEAADGSIGTSDCPRCPTCHSSELGTILGVYCDWGLLHSCPTRKCPQWLVCVKCHHPNARKPMFTKASILGHKKRNHSAGRKRKLADVEEGVVHALFGKVSNCHPSSPARVGSKIPSPMLGNQGQVAVVSPDIKVPTVFGVATDSNMEWLECHSPNSICNSRAESSKFYCHQHGAPNLGGGLEYLLRRSVRQQDLQPAELGKILLRPSHASLHLNIAKLSVALPRTSWGLLVSVLRGCHEVGCEDGHFNARASINEAWNDLLEREDGHLELTKNLIESKLCCRVFDMSMIKKRGARWPIPIPESTNDIRKYYTESTHSIIANLPHPQVRTDIKDHAYLSIVDCIRDFLASLQEDEQLEVITQDTTAPARKIGADMKVTRSCESPRALEILESAQKLGKQVACGLLFWSDDAETNSFSKANRDTSIWVKSFTITMLSRRKGGMRATFPIAAGRKKASHEEVERRFAKELNQLQSQDTDPFYIGTRKRLASIHFETFATLQDQPERRGSNRMLMGNSAFHCRWGVAADHKQLYPKLRPCSDCSQAMEEVFQNKGKIIAKLPHCLRCLNWDALHDVPLAFCTLPADYPTPSPEGSSNPYTGAHPANRTVQVGDTFLIKPFRVDYNGMKQAIDLAHDCYVNHDWKPQNCLAYLKVEGFNEGFVAEFMEHATRAHGWALSQEDEEVDVRDCDSAEFEQVPYPAMSERTGVPLDTHLDCPMHLLFLGIVKALMICIMAWLKVQGKQTSFENATAKILDPIADMSLDWVRIIPFKGKFGGWVSENYLGFSRVMCWFYQNIGNVVAEPSKDLPPEGKPQKTWTQKNNKAWLRERGLPQKGSASDVAARVSEMMERPDCPQPIKDLIKDAVPVQNTVMALQLLLQRLMASSVTLAAVEEADVLIRWFLTTYDHLDCILQARLKDQKPEVTSKWNFLCLMNLPATMLRFGPLRRLWEGDIKGEGILRFVKPQVTQGLRPGWDKNLLLGLVRGEKLKLLETESQPSSREASLFSPLALESRASKFKKYKSTTMLAKMFSCSQPLSVVLVDDGVASQVSVAPCTVYAVASSLDYLIPVRLGELCVDKFGLTYFEANALFHKAGDWMDLVRQKDKLRLGYALLLPLIDADEQKPFYALVSSNWKSLSTQDALSQLVDGDFEQNPHIDRDSH